MKFLSLLMFALLLTLGLLLFSTVASAQLCSVPCPLLDAEINPKIDAAALVWTDGTVLSTSKGISVPSQTFPVSVALGQPLALIACTAKTETAVQYTMSTGGICTGLKCPGFHDPKGSHLIDGRLLDINKPAYACTDSTQTHFTVICFDVVGDVSNPVCAPPYQCDRVEHACSPL